VTKGLLLGTLSTSIILQATKATRRRPSLLVSLFTHALAFRNPGELLFGASLLYFYRIFERQWGSAKYGSFVAVTGCLAYGLEAAAASLLEWRAASGPFPLLFANLAANFVLLVPPMHQFTVFGVKMTDKVQRGGASCRPGLAGARGLRSWPALPLTPPAPCATRCATRRPSSTWRPSSCCSARHRPRWWLAAAECWRACCTASTSWACSACACRTPSSNSLPAPWAAC
jgi:hypothetical protein